MASQDSKRYRALRDAIMHQIETAKLMKFSLDKNPMLQLAYQSDIDNQTLCPICNIRRKLTPKEQEAKGVAKDEEVYCSFCYTFKELGEKLANSKVTERISSDELAVNFDGFETQLELNKKIKSYVLFKDRIPATFEFLAQQSCQNSEDKEGLKALAVLKADVDNMGKFFKKDTNPITDSFEKFDTFSRTIDNFFSDYIPQQLMKEEYKNTYTVFAGGDDLFLVGAWDEILALARKIKEEFETFINIEELSISFGITVAKPTTPIRYLAEYTEELLDKSKSIDEDKNAITLFDETVKWKDYLDAYNKLYPKLQSFHEIYAFKTAFLYQLLALIEMSKKVKHDDDIPSTIWKSKLRYSFSRNILEHIKSNEYKVKEAENLLEVLNEVITNNPKGAKMVVSEFVYQRRKV